MSAARILPCILLLLPVLIHSQQPKLVLPIGHTGGVPALLITPDGKRVITASHDNTIKIWDLASGKFLQDIKGHTASVVSLEFDPGKTRMISASLDGTAILWNVRDGSKIRELTGHRSGLISAQFSPDGKSIMTVSTDRTLRIWDTRDGKLLTVLTSQAPDYLSAQFSPDGNWLLAVMDDKTVIVWNTSGYKKTFTLKGHASYITGASFSPDNRSVVTSSYDSTARVWDLATGKPVFTLRHTEGVYSVRYSPDGKKIATGTWREIVWIWDARDGRLVKQLTRNARYGYLTKLVYSSDGKKLLAVAANYTMGIWDEARSMLLGTVRHESYIETVQISPDGRKALTGSNDRTVKVTDLSDGRLVMDLRGHTSNPKAIAFTPDEKFIITSTAGSTPKIWKVADGQLLTSLNTEGDETLQFYISSDSKKMVTLGSMDKAPRLWKIPEGKPLALLEGHSNLVNHARFSPDGKLLATASFDGTTKIWDTENGNLIRSLDHFYYYVYSVAFSPDGTKLVTAAADGMARVWDVKSGYLYFMLDGNSEYMYSAEFSPDGKKILTATIDGRAKIWDAATGFQLTDMKGPAASFYCASFSADGNWVLVQPFRSDTAGIRSASSGLLQKIYRSNSFIHLSPDSRSLVTVEERVQQEEPGPRIRQWDLRSGDLIADLKGHTGGNIKYAFSPGSTKLITASDDNTIKIWDLQTRKCLYTFFTVDSADYFLQLPSGIYMSSPSATKLLYYLTKDLQIITFEQLDLRYNRPDKVLEVIGNTDTALIKSYRKAWEKRIKKLGIDTSQFRDGYSVPECNFVNRDAVEYEQKNGTLSLHIRGKDSVYKLDRFNIWVNESPLFGQRGINIRRKNSNSIDTTISIILSQGENRIETSITNVNGTESYRMPLQVNYTPAVQQKESLRFIGIGIDQFSDNRNNLQYSCKDIRDLAAKLKEKYKDDIIIDTLFNEHVTAEKVKALKQKLQQTSVNDKVIISYSGHGLLSKDYDYYLSTYSVNFDKPEENGLPYDELENLLDSIPARKKLMLIDACHSGEVDKEEMVRITAAEDSLSRQGTRGGKPTYTGKTTLGMKNSFELMQSLFVNVGKSTGATIISAAAGTQFALERGDLKNGVFTYCILEAMEKNPSMKISELKRIVGERVEQLTNGLQKPTSRNETIAVDWSLW